MNHLLGAIPSVPPFGHLALAAFGTALDGMRQARSLYDQAHKRADEVVPRVRAGRDALVTGAREVALHGGAVVVTVCFCPFIAASFVDRGYEGWEGWRVAQRAQATNAANDDGNEMAWGDDQLPDPIVMTDPVATPHPPTSFGDTLVTLGIAGVVGAAAVVGTCYSFWHESHFGRPADSRFDREMIDAVG